MRDLLPPAGEPPPDPMKAAQAAMRPPLPKRFYAGAGVAEEADGFRVVLDGRAIKTPARRPLLLADRDLAEAVAAEWSRQQSVIDPATMPLTKLVNSALDGVADNPAAVAGDILRYAASDLLCYRADAPRRLVERQAELWDPVLAWARESFGLRFVLTEGIVFAEQPASTLAAFGSLLPTSPLPLAAFSSLTALSGSALLALGMWKCRLTANDAWLAAHVDENFQIEAWGADTEAMERRAFRRLEFDAAATLMRVAP